MIYYGCDSATAAAAVLAHAAGAKGRDVLVFFFCSQKARAFSLAITPVMVWYSSYTGTSFITQDPIQITLEGLFI